MEKCVSVRGGDSFHVVSRKEILYASMLWTSNIFCKSQLRNQGNMIASPFLENYKKLAIAQLWDMVHNCMISRYAWVHMTVPHSYTPRKGCVSPSCEIRKEGIGMERKCMIMLIFYEMKLSEKTKYTRYSQKINSLQLVLEDI